MRYAIFSDIHGNWQAWNAVLADMYDSKVDVPVCLGDIVGYGPCPQKVLDGIREVTTNFVMGNHDAAASGVIDPSMFNDKARAVIEWTRDKLSDDAIEFLKDMALVIEDGELLFVHAEVEEPGRFYYIDSEEEAQDNFQYCTQRITFVGHTHDPAIFAENEDKSVTRMEDVDCVLNTDQRYIINVGSVGEPRNPEDIRARYVIFDTETNEVSFRRIEFDIEGYRMDLVSSGLSIKPYFLTVVDSYLEAVEMAKAADGQMMRDMKTPVHAPTSLSKRKRRIVSNHPGRPPLSRQPLPVIKKSPLPAIFLSISLLLSSVAAGWYFWWLPRQEAAGEISITQDRPSTGLVGMINDELGGNTQTNSDLADDTTEQPAPDIVPPKIVEGGAINYWNFDRPNGEIGEETQFVIRVPSKEHAALIDPVPKSGTKNQKAATGGIWEEPERSEQYSIRGDRSWTLEGWFQTPKITGLKAQKVIAGNRGHVGAGWRFEAREHNGQILNFSYWPDGIQKTAHYFNIPAKDFLDNQPHHFAITWHHNFEAGETGQIKIYIDGALQEGKVNGKAGKKSLEIPLDNVRGSKQSDLFAIGGVRNEVKPLQFTGALDELRFTSGVKTPADFLLADKDGKLPPPKEPEPAPTVAKNETAAPAPPPAPVEPVEPVETLPSFQNGLFFYAPLDKPEAGTVLLDRSPNGRHLHGASMTQNKPGIVGESVHFLSQQIQSKPIPFGGTKALTVAFWIRLDDTQAPNESAAPVFRMPGANSFWLDFTNFQTAQKPSKPNDLPLPKSVWHHIIVSNDGQITQIFHNGIPKAKSRKQPLKLPNADGKIVVLGGKKHTRFQLDEVAIWRRQLTPEERTRLVQIGRQGVQLLSPPLEVTHWKFDSDLSGAVSLTSGASGNSLKPRNPIAPAKLPLTLEENAGSMHVTHLVSDKESAGDFSISAADPFTYEGWFILRPQKTANLGSTLEVEDNQFGWKLGALPKRRTNKGDLIFMVKNGADSIRIANATDQQIFDNKPHHIAAVWQPGAVEGNKPGKLKIFLDGKMVVSQDIDAGDLPEGTANPLEIGGENQDLIVDEIRFTRAAFDNRNFLNGWIPPEKVEQKAAEKGK